MKLKNIIAATVLGLGISGALDAQASDYAATCRPATCRPATCAPKEFNPLGITVSPQQVQKHIRVPRVYCEPTIVKRPKVVWEEVTVMKPKVFYEDRCITRTRHHVEFDPCKSDILQFVGGTLECGFNGLNQIGRGIERGIKDACKPRPYTCRPSTCRPSTCAPVYRAPSTCAPIHIAPSTCAPVYQTPTLAPIPEPGMHMQRAN